MSTANQSGDTAPLPEKGTRVLLDGLPGGPWSSVVDGVGEGTLVLDPPRLGGRVVDLPLRRRFTVAYSSREVPCEVDAELVEAPTADHPRYTARILGATRRTQRRGAVRVPVHLIVRAILSDEEEPEVIDAITEDLSAGGALLRMDRMVKAGATLTTTILCGGDVGAVEFQGRVVRCDRVGTEQRPFRVAFAFLDMPRADEDRLVRFLFERQRELRRRDAGLD